MTLPIRSQGNLINIINEYLEWNKTGVCHGLAVVHAKYVLADIIKYGFINLDNTRIMPENIIQYSNNATTLESFPSTEANLNI